MLGAVLRLRLPRSVVRGEKQILTKLVRWPFTAAGKAELLHAEVVEGPSCPSLEIASEATRLRFSATSSVDIDFWAGDLHAAAVEGTSMARWQQGL